MNFFMHLWYSNALPTSLLEFCETSLVLNGEARDIREKYFLINFGVKQHFTEVIYNNQRFLALKGGKLF